MRRAEENELVNVVRVVVALDILARDKTAHAVRDNIHLRAAAYRFDGGDFLFQLLGGLYIALPEIITEEKKRRIFLVPGKFQRVPEVIERVEDWIKFPLPVMQPRSEEPGDNEHGIAYAALLDGKRSCIDDGCTAIDIAVIRKKCIGFPVMKLRGNINGTRRARLLFIRFIVPDIVMRRTAESDAEVAREGLDVGAGKFRNIAAQTRPVHETNFRSP